MDFLLTACGVVLAVLLLILLGRMAWAALVEWALGVRYGAEDDGTPEKVQPRPNLRRVK